MALQENMDALATGMGAAVAARMADMGGGGMTLLHRQVFLASGTWTKPNVEGKLVRVVLVGGGGGAYFTATDVTDGGASTFGSTSAGGGARTIANAAAPSAPGSGNIAGVAGALPVPSGRGGVDGVPLNRGAGGARGSTIGGQGGMTADELLFSVVGASVSVTVGAGGISPEASSTNGQPGYVVVEVWG